jgi:hypothetical protein
VQSATLPEWVNPTVVGTTSAAIDESVYAYQPTAGTTYRWDPTSQQYIYNWQSPKNGVGNVYRIGVTLEDGKSYYVNVGLK